MLAAEGFGPAGEPAAVVGQHGLDLHRRGLTKSAQEVRAAGLALVGIDAQEHPARGAVDGHEQVAPRDLEEVERLPPALAGGDEACDASSCWASE